MDEKFTITLQVTAEQGEKIFKLLAGTKSRQARYSKRKRQVITTQPELPAPPVGAWHVYEVEPSLYPVGLQDSLTVLVSDREKADLIPAFQDMSGVDKDDPSSATLLANGNRFYATEVDSFDTKAKATAFAKQYAIDEGIDYSLPSKYPEYYEVAPLRG